MQDQATKRRRFEPPETRRAQILEAAKACFVKSGFATTKVSDIAEHAGISVGLVYRYFPGKEALVEAIVAEDAQAQVSRLVDLFGDETMDARSAVRRFVADLRPTLADRNRSALMIEIAAEVARNDKLLAATTGPQMRAAKGLLNRMKAFSQLDMSAEELDVRLRLVGALSTGAAIQLSARPDLGTELFFDLLERTAEQILRP